MKKSPIKPTGEIQKGKIPDLELRFSFKFFDSSDSEVCPPVFRENYTQTLMQRLKDLSTWNVQEFINSRHKSVRVHMHDWGKTSRLEGFKHLNEQLRDHEGWQFQLSANEHGRVHGILIGNTFYVIWLDQNHKLYPFRKFFCPCCHK